MNQLRMSDFNFFQLVTSSSHQKRHFYQLVNGNDVVEISWKRKWMKIWMLPRKRCHPIVNYLEEGQQKWEVRRVYFYILKVYAYGVSYEAWIWDLNFWCRMMNFFLETMAMIRKNAIITLKWMPWVDLSDPAIQET